MLKLDLGVVIRALCQMATFMCNLEEIDDIFGNLFDRQYTKVKLTH